MKANDLARQFGDKGLSGEYLSARQGDWLYDMAHKEGQTTTQGQRTASGEFDGKSWKLVRDQSRWLFSVQEKSEDVQENQEEGAYISREITHPFPPDFWKDAPSDIPESI